MSSVFPYYTNLFYVNADQTTAVRRSLGKRFYRHRYNIGYWVWELDEFPERWQHAFTPYREIWTPSNFCRQAVGRKASIPVFCVPYSVAPIAPAGMDREYFGLAPDKFLFLTAFDVLSVTERKNPLAAIRAFGKAFGPNSGCQLIVKVNNARAGAEYVEQLRNACDNGSILIFDSTLGREQMDALTNCVDCVVSLHRSEGFGLFIAEAMYLGKPVIVTNYSGNTDFTRPDNSMLVDYRMIPVGRNCAPYDPASLWADPDVEHAAAHMKTIAQNKDLRVRLSQAGREFVREALSAETIGKAMHRRLEALRDPAMILGSLTGASSERAAHSAALPSPPYGPGAPPAGEDAADKTERAWRVRSAR
jgi:glycosyltransferase involved in cell wall biosynthesis